MTREIALHCMKSYSELHSDLCELCPIYGQTGSDHCFEDALQYVIGMLEQEPIIDKVKQARKEIKNDVKFWSDSSKYNEESLAYVRKAKARSYKHCLEIPDKLIESEDT